MKASLFFMVCVAFVQYVQCDTDPTCELGIIKDDICCALECGTCGGSGCSLRPGGASSCCGRQIELARVSCNDDVAPCNIASDDNDPACELGIIYGNYCCPSECGECGGPGCGSRPGGGSDCCGTSIRDSGLFCDFNDAPCIIHPNFQEDPPIPNDHDPIPDPNCEFGIAATGVNDNVCCVEECGTCGGPGCTDRSLETGFPCCGGAIYTSGISCDEYGAPCLISAPTPEPTGPDPNCENGLIKNDICCPTECPFCGGPGCGESPGGSFCCGGPIRAWGLSCDDVSAPCVIGL